MPCACLDTGSEHVAFTTLNEIKSSVGPISFALAFKPTNGPTSFCEFATFVVLNIILFTKSATAAGNSS